MSTKNSLLLATATLGLVACGSTPKAPDTTPLAPTSVLTANYVINGYILPDSRGKQTVYTLGDRRRIDYQIEYDSWAASTFLGASNTSNVARIDQNLSWYINKENNEYRECPLAGCASSIWDSLNTAESEEEEDTFDPSAGESCQLSTAKFDFTVTDKKTTRQINGFTAKQYTAQWLLTSKDEAGRPDKHVVNMDFWMTQPTDNMRDAWAINGEFQDNYLAKVSDDKNPLSKFFGEEIYKTVAMVSGDIKKDEIASDSPVITKLNAIEGYPVSIKLAWYMDKQSCPEIKEKKKSASLNDIDINDPMNSLKDITGGFFKDKAEEAVDDYFKPDPKKPIFNYVYDVTQVQVNDEHMSVFNLPTNAKLTNRD